MNTILVSDVQALVRRNLDELDPNGSWMYGDEGGSSSDFGDNKQLDALIARFVPECINEVQLAAPVHLLEGESSHVTPSSIESDGSFTFYLGGSVKFLRLVAFKGHGSNILVNDAIPEGSAEARKQLNAAIRGRADRPRLVRLQKLDATNGQGFTFYACGSGATTANAVDTLLYITEQTYNSVSPASSYNCSRLVKSNVIDCVTSRVLAALGDQRAEAFLQKALNFNI